MADKPILKIDIDDAKFQKFYALFQDYSDKLDEQPAAWKKLNSAIASSGQGMVTPISKISGHFSDTADSSGDIAKSVNASTKAMQDLFAATAKSNVAMSALMNSSAGVAKGLFDAGAGLLGIKKVLGAFGTLGKVLGVGLGVLGGAGDLALRSAGSVSNTARAAFGANSSYGQFQNANAQLSPFLPNPGGSLQNIAAAQWSPAAQGSLGLFGVTSRETPAQALATVLRSSVRALRSSHNLGLPQVTYAEQLTGLSQTDMISLANQRPGDLNAAIQRSLNPKLNTAQDVPPGVISADQKLVASWAASMNTASAKFAAALAPLNPMVQSFGQSVAGFAGAVSSLVGDVTSQSPGLPKTSGLGKIFPGLPKVLGGLGPDAPGGQGSSPWGPTTRLTPNLTSFSAVMSDFMKDGLSKKAAAALTGNAAAESSFRTNVISTYKGKKQGGLFQYLATRRDKVLAETRAAGLNGGKGYDMWKGTEQEQVAGATWDLNHDYKGALAKINAAPNAITAGTAADKYYEISADTNIQRMDRGIRAGIFNAIGPNPAPPPGVSPDVHALLTQLGKQNIIKVRATVQNNTSARVTLSAQAAVH